MTIAAVLLPLLARTQAAVVHARAKALVVAQLDFKHETEKSRVAINKFIEAKTERKIKELIPPGTLKDDAGLVITNAVYFKASWAMPFPEEATKDDWFHISASKAVRAKLMS